MTKNIVWHQSEIFYSDKCDLLSQKSFVIWFTGLSGSGKSTIATQLEKQLYQRGYLTCWLDGDNVRHGLNSDLGFSRKDRNENIRRIMEVAKILQDTGVIVIVSCISPYREMRDRARDYIGKDKFVEVYVNASLDVCVARDTKGLYHKADQQQLENFTEISANYEIPTDADIVLNTNDDSIIQSVGTVMHHLSIRKLIMLDEVKNHK
ncbi:MAG: adenylyl-sulfate kinase [Gammaproteobacteria bacterium]|jgi:adenylyl-sulfate kinase